MTYATNPYAENFPRARSSDPSTSFAAAASITKMVSRHHQIILDCLTQYGPMGKDLIASYTQLGGNQIARRLKEMNTLGLIALTDRMVKSNSGRSEREWRIA
jgi:predicted transcriptional regulator